MATALLASWCDVAASALSRPRLAAANSFRDVTVTGTLIRMLGDFLERNSLQRKEEPAPFRSCGLADRVACIAAQENPAPCHKGSTQKKAANAAFFYRRTNSASALAKQSHSCQSQTYKSQ
jgi:hypothetical protein